MQPGISIRDTAGEPAAGTIALLLLLAVVAAPAAVRAEDLSEARLVEQLRARGPSADAALAGGGAVARTMRMPDRNGACPTAEAGPSGSPRNLVVVPMAPAGAPQVDLSLQFEYASYRLTSGDRRQLDLLGRAMSHPDLRTARFTVAGHTDSAGDAVVNQKLSCARALAVLDYLMERGVAADRLSAYGFGSARPVRPGEVDAPINRRVEIRRSEGS